MLRPCPFPSPSPYPSPTSDQLGYSAKQEAGEVEHQTSPGEVHPVEALSVTRREPASAGDQGLLWLGNREMERRTVTVKVILSR